MGSQSFTSDFARETPSTESLLRLGEEEVQIIGDEDDETVWEAEGDEPLTQIVAGETPQSFQEVKPLATPIDPADEYAFLVKWGFSGYEFTAADSFVLNRLPTNGHVIYQGEEIPEAQFRETQAADCPEGR